MHHAIYAFLTALPWVVPIFYGPEPAAAVWALSGACLGTVGLMAFASWGGDRGVPFGVGGAAAAWAAAALLSAALALLQYFGTAANHALGPWVNTAQLGEAYANLRQRNHFATLTNIGLAALLWWQVAGRAGPLKRLFSGMRPALPTTVGFAAAALLAVGNAASGSRTGLLQLVLLGLCAWVWRSKQEPWTRSPQCKTWVVAACAYALAALLLPILIGLDPNTAGILARLQDAEATCQSRRVLWANVLHLIAQKPWFGWGWGELDYAHLMTLYPGPRFCDILDNAHNLPLHLAVELGVPFSFLACGLVVWLVVRQRPWREANPTRQLAWAVLALIGSHSMLEYPLWYGPFQMAVALAVLILWQTPPGAVLPYSAQPTGGPAMRWAVGSVSALALIGCAYAAWDYWRISQIYTPPPQRAAAYREDALQKLQASWLFRDYVRFAELTTAPLTRDNADRMHALAVEMLHFSPEPKVARLVIESATLLGRETEAAFYLQRFKAAFPNEAL